VRKNFYRNRPLFLAITSMLLCSGSAWAQNITPPAPATDDTGFTILSNATNVTHWGLGLGTGVEEEPYEAEGKKFSPYPLILFDDKWVHVLGTTVDLKVGKWDNVSVALRAQYSLGGGYRASDSPALSGMQTRIGALWFGPSLAWNTPYGTLSGDVLSSDNKGQKAKIEFAKAFAFGKFSIEPHVSSEWFSQKYVNYYYGVQASEVQPGRAMYTGKASYDNSVGATFAYHITPRQLVSFDLDATRLGSGMTDSPIVGKKLIPQARLGYLYQFN
jgi:outer membrane protein